MVAGECNARRRNAARCSVSKEQPTGIHGFVKTVCAEPGCRRQPMFNTPGQKRVKFCVSHKGEGMVNIAIGVGDG